MEGIEIKKQKYRECIPTHEITEAFKVYYETKDKIIRKNLIYRYMPKVRKIVLNYGITTIEPEDLEQMAYEILIKCVDNYNPYCQNIFSKYLIYELNKINKKTSEIEKISLSECELYSSEKFEDNLINKIGNEELIEMINELLDKYRNQRHVEIFKKLCMCDYENLKEFSQKENLKRSTIQHAKKFVLIYIYLNLPKELQYYPSETMEKLIVDPSLGFLYSASKTIKNGLKELNIKDAKYIDFYDSNVNKIDSNIKIKTKELEYK